MEKIAKRWGLLIIILLIGLFFRLYKLDLFYIFGHDQDLYSWIVKDIYVNGHIRLIGQLTSIEGVFIGPIFYYLLVPFFVLTDMNPIGATIPATLIGLITIYSIYYVFGKFFGKSTGLIGATIYASTLPLVFFDRWVVPTQPTVLWSVWFLYCLFSLAGGEFKKPLLITGLLAALIWHIHVALLPLLLLIPLSIVLSRKKLMLKDTLVPLIIFFIVLLPFIVFELKYNFQQIHSMLASTTQAMDESGGLYRFMRIIDITTQYFINNFLSVFIQDIKVNKYIGIPLISAAFYFIARKKILSKRQIIICLGWVGVIIFAQATSKRALSEYYLANFIPIALLLVSGLVAYIYTHFNRKLVILVVAVFTGANLYQLITRPDPGDGYSHKREIVQFIKSDMETNNYACAGINYITAPGVGVGFKYMLWENNVSTISPGKGAPNYNIVIPCSTSYSEITKCSGIVGVIVPPKTEFSEEVCKDPQNQELPMLGFTSN